MRFLQLPESWKTVRCLIEIYPDFKILITWGINGIWIWKPSFVSNINYVTAQYTMNRLKVELPRWRGALPEQLKTFLQVESANFSCIIGPFNSAACFSHVS